MTEKKQHILCILVVIAMLAMATAGVSAASTKTITDMAGRTVTIPENITSVLGTAPPVTVMTYIIAPELLSGFNSNYNTSKYLPDTYKNLPNVGGIQGNTKLNAESFQSMHPDIILYGLVPGYYTMSDIDDIQRQLDPIPVVAVGDITNISNFAPGMKFLGDLYNKPEKAEEFNTFYEDLLKRINQSTASLPDAKRKKVYYAEGPDGLMTDPASSNHAQPINVCGGINVANIEWTNVVGRTQVSLEQVMNWDPDVIIAADKQFYDKVYTDPTWKNVRAVADKQVYLIPSQPFSWYDRSPGVNIVIGIPWTAKVLYPEIFKNLDLDKIVKDFYTKFYHYPMTDQEAEDIITASGLSAD